MGKRLATPQDLQKAGRAVCRRLNEFYEVERASPEGAEIELLHQLCRCADRLQALRAAIGDAGVMVDGKLNPAVVEERQQTDLLRKLTLTLGLPTGIANEAKRTQPSRRAERAAQVRWHGRAG